jgi:hypothetical protein
MQAQHTVAASNDSSTSRKNVGIVSSVKANPKIPFITFSILCIPVLCVYCVVVEYNADSVPSFQSPMITGLLDNVLCMYTVLRVLLCYRKVLPCYR